MTNVPFLGKKHARVSRQQAARKKQIWWRMLTTCLLSRFVEFHSAIPDKKSNIYKQVRGMAATLIFQSAPKNRNLAEGVAILLPAKFRWIPFSGCRGVENVSVNQRLGWQSCFSVFRMLILATCAPWHWPWRFDPGQAHESHLAHGEFCEIIFRSTL